jgi:hypothetical protein
MITFSDGRAPIIQPDFSPYSGVDPKMKYVTINGKEVLSTPWYWNNSWWAAFDFTATDLSEYTKVEITAGNDKLGDIAGGRAWTGKINFNIPVNGTSITMADGTQWMEGDRSVGWYYDCFYFIF